MGCCGWNEVHKLPTVPSTPAPEGPRHLIAVHRARAEVDLLGATGGRSICRVEGPDTALVKGAEGRMAALAELDRLVRGSEGAASDLAAEVLGRWAVERTAAAGRGVAWRAYFDGGVAELEDVGRALDTLTHPGCEAAP